MISACSKVKRFGIDSLYSGKSGRSQLIQEMGDVLCMIELVCAEYHIDRNLLIQAQAAKLEKLKIWAPLLFEGENV